MAYLKKLPYNHFNPTKPQLRITYHSDGTKTEQKLEVKPDTYQGERFQQLQQEMAERLDPSTFPLKLGEYDRYDMTRNQRKELIEKEI